MINQQKGVALLTVLLLVVSITVIASVMLVGQNLTIRKSSLLFGQDKQVQYIRAGQQLAIQAIKSDNAQSDSDGFQRNWAKKIPPYNTDEGYIIEIRLHDASAKFNINNLYHDGQADKQALEIFERLLASLNLDISLAKMILDWQDPDGQVHDDTAQESSAYGSDKNTQVANQPFIDINQLSDLPNITAETINTLRPYVTAVPYWLPVNVNTASEKVLMAIAGEQNSGAVQTLIAQRNIQAINSQEELDSLQLLSDQNSSDTDIDDTDQESDETDSDDSTSDQADNALLSIKSRAFEGLVTVKDNNTPPKIRYSTFKIAKGQFLTEEDGSEEGDESLQIFASRLWAFKPVFLSANTQ